MHEFSYAPSGWYAMYIDEQGTPYRAPVVAWDTSNIARPTPNVRGPVTSDVLEQHEEELEDWRHYNELGRVALVVHAGRLIRASDVEDSDAWGDEDSEDPENPVLYTLGGVFHREHCPEPARAVQICA